MSWVSRGRAFLVLRIDVKTRRVSCAFIASSHTVTQTVEVRHIVVAAEPGPSYPVAEERLRRRILDEEFVWGWLHPILRRSPW